MLSKTRLVAAMVAVAALASGALAALPAGAAAPQAPSPAGPPLVTGHVRPLSGYLQQGLDPAQAVLVRKLDGLAAAGAPRSALQPRYVRRPAASAGVDGVSCTSFLFVFLFSLQPSISAAGDLNADGRPDVLESHYAEAGKHAYTWVLNARDGRTGRVLWSRRTRLGVNHYAFAVPTRTGKAGHPGVVLFDDAEAWQQSSSSFQVSSSDRVTGLDGRGRTLWQHTDAGSFTDGSNGVSFMHEPAAFYLSQLRRGASDLVVVSHNTAGGTVTTSTVRVSGADGRVTTPLPKLTQPKPLMGSGDPSSPEIPEVGILSDQNHDGLDDFYSAVVGDHSALTAYRGDTGAQLWVNTTLPMRGFAVVEDAGRLTSSTGPEDLVVTTQSVLPAEAVTPLGQVGGEATQSISLVTGGTGLLAWTKPGGNSYVLQRAGAAHTPAVGITSYQESLSAGTESVDATISTYDAHGLPVWQHSYTYSHAADDCGTGVAMAFTGIGDLDGDGGQEGQLLFLIADGTGFYPAVRTVSAKDGAELDQSWDGGLGASLDGSGDDRIGVDEDAKSLRVRGERGVGLGRLWSRSFTPGGTPEGAEVVPLPITSTRCTDVGVLAYGEKGEIASLLASNGLPRWTVTYRDKDASTGHLVAGTSSRGYC